VQRHNPCSYAYLSGRRIGLLVQRKRPSTDVAVTMFVRTRLIVALLSAPGMSPGVSGYSDRTAFDYCSAVNRRSTRGRSGGIASFLSVCLSVCRSVRPIIVSKTKPFRAMFTLLEATLGTS